MFKLEVSGVDRKPSITITLSSDGEEDEGAIVEEELRDNVELCTSEQEKWVGDEEEMEKVVNNDNDNDNDLAKEDVAARLEADVREAESETRDNVKQIEATNTDNADEREEKEDTTQPDVAAGAKTTLALVGKLANIMLIDKDQRLDETNEKQEEVVEERSAEASEAANADEMTGDLVPSGRQVVEPGFVRLIAPNSFKMFSWLLYLTA